MANGKHQLTYLSRWLRGDHVEDFESTHSATKAERRRFHGGAASYFGIAYAG
jgi:hypothetical protein